MRYMISLSRSQYKPVVLEIHAMILLFLLPVIGFDLIIAVLSGLPLLSNFQ